MALPRLPDLTLRRVIRAAVERLPHAANGGRQRAPLGVGPVLRGLPVNRYDIADAEHLAHATS